MKMVDILSPAKKGVEYGVSLGADQVEVCAVNLSQFRVEVRNAHVTGSDILEVGGAGVRVYVNGSLGIASTSRLTELRGTVEKAYHLAKGAPADPYFKSLPGPSKYELVERLYDKKLAVLPFEELAARFMEGIEAASPESGFTVSGNLARAVEESAVVNSLGVEAFTSETTISGYISSKIEKNGDTGLGEEPIMGRSLEEFNPVKAGDKAAETARSHLGAKKVTTGTVAVILDFRTARNSLGGVLDLGASGLNVALGTSFLSDRIGARIAPPSLSVVDDPHTPGGLSSCPFDDEGAPSTRVEIVEKGILKSFITDSYSAGRLGIPNTGHASRSGLTSKPVPSLTNINIAPGDWKLEELISGTERGVLLENSRLGPQGVSTNVSSMVDRGLYIEKGEVVHPVKNTMIGTTVFDLLANIDAITKETLKEGGSVSPALRISKIRVAGGL
jgi:PmbA protein